MQKCGSRNTKSPGHVLEAGLQNTKKSLGKWIPGNKQSLGIREETGKNLQDNLEEEFSQHGRQKGGQDSSCPQEASQMRRTLKEKVELGR